jgi:hypothetical protein
MAAVRKTAGLTLTFLGVAWLAIYGIVMLRLPLPIPGVLLRRLGGFALYVDPVEAPIWAVVFLTAGVLLLRRPKAAGSKS